MTRCNAAVLADQANALTLLLNDADLKMLKAQGTERQVLSAQVDDYQAKLERVDAQVCRKYASTPKGAAFQVSAIERAVSVLRSSVVTDEQREELLLRIERACESVSKFFAKTPDIQAQNALHRARALRR